MFFRGSDLHCPILSQTFQMVWRIEPIRHFIFRPTTPIEGAQRHDLRRKLWVKGKFVFPQICTVHPGTKRFATKGFKQEQTMMTTMMTGSLTKVTLRSVARPPMTKNHTFPNTKHKRSNNFLSSPTFGHTCDHQQVPVRQTK